MGLRDLGWEPSEIHDFAYAHAIKQTQYVGWIHVWEEECILRVWAYRTNICFSEVFSTGMFLPELQVRYNVSSLVSAIIEVSVL